MKINTLLTGLALSSLVLFSGCGSDDTDTTASSYTYSVKVTNITAGQAMSPVLVTSSSIFTVGESASSALEKQAEGGDNSELLTGDAVSSGALLMPGATQTVSITTAQTKLSLTTMLVKTNDGFAGVDSLDVSALAVNASTTLSLGVLDAGTEANEETNTTVPGLGGEGYNATRVGSDIITAHNGIISKDDGLVSSHLTSTEKFNNPAVLVTITRTK